MGGRAGAGYVDKVAWIETVCMYHAGTYRVLLACDDAPQIVTASREEAVAAAGIAAVERAERGARWVLSDGSRFTVLPHDWVHERPSLLRTSVRAQAVSLTSEAQVAAAEEDLRRTLQVNGDLGPASTI